MSESSKNQAVARNIAQRLFIIPDTNFYSPYLPFTTPLVIVLKYPSAGVMFCCFWNLIKAALVFEPKHWVNSG